MNELRFASHQLVLWHHHATCATFVKSILTNFLAECKKNFKRCDAREAHFFSADDDARRGEHALARCIPRSRRERTRTRTAASRVVHRDEKRSTIVSETRRECTALDVVSA
ncbi:MAG: hypothetical protein DCC68_07315 [Planctomycetota bacterium]|nr:MAG: hypothetical protein DCC68_07315 [Planctomycetota bacterium]